MRCMASFLFVLHKNQSPELFLPFPDDLFFRTSLFSFYLSNKFLCDFSSFLENLESRSKGHASPGPTNGQSPSSGSQSPVVPPSGASTGSSSPSTPQPPLASQMLPQAPSAPSPAPPTAVVSGTFTPMAEIKPHPQSPEHQQSPSAPGGSGPQKRSFISRWFGSSAAAEIPASGPGRFRPASGSLLLQICQNV